jgi:polyphosphate kinase
MPRNLYERVEVMFPVKDELLRQRVRQEILEAYLADTLKARLLQRDGSYVRVRDLLRRHPRRVSLRQGFSAQDFLIGLAEGKQVMDSIPRPRAPRRSRSLIAREP